SHPLGTLPLNSCCSTWARASVACSAEGGAPGRVAASSSGKPRRRPRLNRPLVRRGRREGGSGVAPGRAGVVSGGRSAACEGRGEPGNKGVCGRVRGGTRPKRGGRAGAIDDGG